MIRTTALFSAVLVSGIILSSPAYAVCSSPAGAAGAMGYNVTAVNNLFQYCNNTNWISMSFGSSGAGCATAGQMRYNSTVHALQFCNGTNWINAHAPGPGGAGCTSPTAPEGGLNYNSVALKVQVCTGTAWVNSPV